MYNSYTFISDGVTITHLTVGAHFNRFIYALHGNDTVVYLAFGKYFNQSIDGLRKNKSIKK
jgi:hypothetical protein